MVPAGSDLVPGEGLVWTGRNFKGNPCFGLARTRGGYPGGWTPLNSSFQLVHLLNTPDRCVSMTCWQRDALLITSNLNASEDGANVSFERPGQLTSSDRGAGDAP